jgi:cytidylate kinase
MAVITISRQYGSGGDEVAERVCEILGYNYFDKQMMVETASEVGLSEEEIVDFSEDNYVVRGFWDRLLGLPRRARMKTRPQDKEGGQEITVQLLNKERGVDLVRSTILTAYEHGNVLILGRGGQIILRENPGVLHVRIRAPMGARVLRIQRKEDFTLEEARQQVMRRDESASEYLRQFFDIEWDNPMLYHLCLNTGRWDIEAAAQIIVNALSHLPKLNMG